MKPIHLRFETSFFIRWGLIGGMTLMMALVPVMLMRSGGLLKMVMPLGALAILLLPWREWRRAARIVDDEGITRHDGRRFLWSDLKKLQEVNFINRYGQSGSLNHLDIHFTTGHARILPMVLENGYAAIRHIQQRHGKPASAAQSPAPASPPPPAPAAASAPAAAPPLVSAAPVTTYASPARCSLCGDLGSHHFAMQKHGRENEDTFLPPAIKNLKFVKDLRPGTTRSPELLRCPECGSYFLFKIGYEYLATGSEDDQELSRLTAQEAQELLAGS